MLNGNAQTLLHVPTCGMAVLSCVVHDVMTTRDPTVLHQRVLGVLRLLGPRHWASWRLLLLGVELHCGAIEEAMMKVQVRQESLIGVLSITAAKIGHGLIALQATRSRNSVVVAAATTRPHNLPGTVSTANKGPTMEASVSAVAQQIEQLQAHGCVRREACSPKEWVR